MQMKELLPFINPVQWIRAGSYARKHSHFQRSANDPELHLYSKILNSRMLHYGYFDDTEIIPEEISLAMFERAQARYAGMIMEHITDRDNVVLDVGCGLGGLAGMMRSNGFETEVVTPDANQAAFIMETLPLIRCHQCKFENFEPAMKYGTLINAESLQYINLAKAFRKAEESIQPGGKWIIADYFRTSDDSRGGHLLSDFLGKAAEYNWKIELERNITPNVLPTLRFLTMYIGRIVLPPKEYGYEKFRLKRPRLYFLSGKLREKVDRKILKETAVIDPEIFAGRRRYMLFVLKKA